MRRDFSLRHLGLRRIFAVAAFVVGLGLAGHVSAEVPVPKLLSRVTDLTSTLTSSQRAGIEAQLDTLEREKGAQVDVLIIKTTEPESIEQYALRVAETWKLGRKGVDDGAILVIAKNDRKLRIEVGYGLEGALPDATAKRIIDEQIVPEFRQGNYFAGIQSGVDAIIKVVSGEPLPEPKLPATAPSDINEGYVVLFVILVIILQFFSMTSYGRRRMGYWGGGYGGYYGGGGWGGSSGGGGGGGHSGGGGSFGGGGASGSW